jgi:hypothetical protein
MKSVGGGMKRVGTTPSFISPSLNNNNNNNNNRIRMSIDWDDKESNGAAAASPPRWLFFFLRKNTIQIFELRHHLDQKKKQVDCLSLFLIVFRFFYFPLCGPDFIMRNSVVFPGREYLLESCYICPGY